MNQKPKAKYKNNRATMIIDNDKRNDIPLANHKYSRFPELIAKLMINKLISCVITEKKRKDFNKIMDKYMIDFAIDSFQSLLQSNYVAYDKDDYMKQNHSQTQMFFDHKKNRENTWEEIDQPSRRKTEREASSLIKIVKPDNQLPEDQYTTENKHQIINDEEMDYSIKPMDYNQEQIKLLENSNRIKDDLLNSKPNNSSPEKKVIDILSYEIPNKEQLNYQEREGDAYLRMNYEIEKIKQKDQLEKMLEEEKKKKKIKIYTLRPKKEFNGASLTFDSNGKIIQIQRKNPEYLPQDFTWLKPQIKEVKRIENSLYRKTRYKQFIPYSNDKDKEKDLQVFIEYNNYEDDLEAYAAQRSRKVNSKSYVPCGSTFDIIQPATGVKVVENERTKEGSNDFYKKYKKTSLNEYNKMFNDSLIYNSNSSKRLILMSSQTKETNEDNNESTLDQAHQQHQNDQRHRQSYVGYNENIQSSNNPLVQNAKQRSNSADIIPNEMITIPQHLVNTKLNPLIIKGRNNSSINSAVMNGCSDSIRRIFDLPFNDYNKHYPSINNSSKNDSLFTLGTRNHSSLNIFETRNRTNMMMSSNQSLNELNVMDSFNKNILSRKRLDWGNDIRIGKASLMFNQIDKNQSFNKGLEKLSRDRRLTRTIKFNSLIH